MVEFIELLKQSEMGEALITFVVSMLPIIELRGAIPLGVGLGLHPLYAMIVSMVGNMVPVPFIIFFIRKIFAWLRKKSKWLEGVVLKIEARAEGKWAEIHKYELLGLFIFVAIPLPGTGAWTGALIAALMNMRIRNAMLCIFGGVIVAGLVITVLTYGVVSLFGV